MNVPIEKIFENKDNILCIKPKDSTFDKIYRSAKGVHWDNAGQYLYHDKPKQWDAVQWYKQITIAVNDEYGVVLQITPLTIFEGLDVKTVSDIREMSFIS